MQDSKESVQFFREQILYSRFPAEKILVTDASDKQLKQLQAMNVPDLKMVAEYYANFKKESLSAVPEAVIPDALRSQVLDLFISATIFAKS